MKNTKSIIIFALLIVISVMAVGYSSFEGRLTLNGTAEIVGEWNVRIIGIETQDVSEGCDPGDPQFTNTSVTFSAKLLKPGDSITYLITIQNAGTIDVALDNIIFMEDPNGSEAINFTTSDIDHVLKAGNQTVLNVKVEYDPNTTEVPSIKTKSITGIIEYVQK